MIRLAYSTNAYTRWPLDRAVADIRSRGFDGVEILADVPHAFPPADAEALKSALGGFPVSNLNANTYREQFAPSLIDPDAKARKTRVEYTKRVIDLARALGAGNVAISTGPAVGEKSKRRGLLLDSLDQVLAYAERKPEVRVGIEYEPGHFVGDLHALLGILTEIDHPLLGANLDIGHAECVKDSIPGAIDALRGRIWNLHVEDIKKRVHEHLIPGRGDIDWKKFRAALEKAAYDRFVTLEIYPYKDNPGEAGTESLAFLRKVFA